MGSQRIGREVEVLDSTLREGSQARGVSFTLQSKLKIAQELDRLGVHIIELGWPGSNPKDIEVFKAISEYGLRNSKIAAFTSTRRKGTRPEEDPSLDATLGSGAGVAVVFGKSWKLHCERVLNVTPEENLDMIEDSISYLREHGMEVVYDAEHFFDGYFDDPEYAVGTVKAAERCGATRVVLADTNGGTMPHQVEEVVKSVSKVLKVPIGVHMHNDSGNAVANTTLAVIAGASHVQVTVNGIGERAGNADLCQVLPNLELKLNVRALKTDLPRELRLRSLTKLSSMVYEASGISRNPYQPYVGDFVFAHKGGVHIDAVMKDCRAYEHIDPELVGNRRLVTVSDLSGRSAIVAKMAEDLQISMDKREEVVEEVLKKVKEMGLRDLELDNADATVYLLLLKHMGKYRDTFEVEEWMAVAEGDERSSRAFGVIKARVGVDSAVEGSEGVGPVNAIDLALRKALLKNYPQLSKVRLVDYRVILPEVSRDTASVVRVFIQFTDDDHTWCTTSTSKNIIEASVSALIQGLDYYLQKLKLKGEKVTP
jgi:2-isopropylmalate synthase